jgi:hypothetical protein
VEPGAREVPVLSVGITGLYARQLVLHLKQHLGVMYTLPAY